MKHAEPLSPPLLPGQSGCQAGLPLLGADAGRHLAPASCTAPASLSLPTAS
jgi:hypothetical protein